MRLTNRIKAAKDLGRTLKKGVSDWFRDIYYPSVKSLVGIGILLCLTNLLIRWNARCASVDKLTQVARLQPIAIGIALIFVPITVFAVGLSSRRTPSGVTTAEVILKETYLFPIAILVIGIVANLVWVATVAAAITVILATLAFAIFTLYRLVLVLLDGHLQYVSGIAILQDKIRRSINLAVAERLGKNRLLKALEEMPIEYSPFRRNDPDETFYVRHTRQGTVQDVALEKLATFANELERLANGNNYSFSEKKVLVSVPSSILGPINPAAERTLRVMKERYLTKLVGDPITPQDLVIAHFPRKLIPDASDRERLAQMAIDAFVVRRKESYSERVQRLLAEIKDEAIRAIQGKQTGSLVDLLSVYAYLAEAFLMEMAKLGGGYSFAAARRENQSLVGGWNEVRWIRSQLYEIHYRGCRSEDLFIARQVASVPNSIAYAAIRFRDHLLFSEFTSFALYLYLSSQAAADENVRSLLLDRSWRYLQELGDYGVEWELRKTDEDTAALETIGDFGTTILVRYQELLKVALEKPSVSDFTTFLEAASRLFTHVGMPHDNASDIGTQSLQLSMPGLSDYDRRRITQRINRLKILQQIAKNLDSQKRQMLFGIGSLALDKSLERPAMQEFAALRGSAEGVFGQDAVALTTLYIESCQPKVRDLWGWEWWGRIPEGGGFIADRSASLTQYYCYLLLRSCQGIPNQQIGQFDLPRDRDFILDLGAQGKVATTFNTFVNDRGKWGHLIPEAWLSAIPALQALFAKLISDQKRGEEDRVIAYDLNPNRVAEFKAGFITKFEESALVRNIFETFQAFKDDTSAFVQSPGTPQWGLNLLDDKAAYIQDAGQLYRDWGENYGWQLASSESLFAMENVLKQLPAFACPGVQGIEAKLLAAAAALGETGTTAKLILTSLDAEQRLKLEHSSRFEPGWRVANRAWKGISNFEGSFSLGEIEVPVFGVRSPTSINVVCVLDLPKCLRWIQKSPADILIELESLHKFFYFSIEDLSKDSDLRTQIVAENPPWLVKYQEKDRYLRQRVHLRILERFEIELLDSTAGYKLDVN